MQQCASGLFLGCINCHFLLCLHGALQHNGPDCVVAHEWCSSIAVCLWLCLWLWLLLQRLYAVVGPRPSGSEQQEAPHPTALLQDYMSTLATIVVWMCKWLDARQASALIEEQSWKELQVSMCVLRPAIGWHYLLLLMALERLRFCSSVWQ